MENIDFYTIRDCIFYDLNDTTYTISTNIDEDIKRMKSLTYPPFTVTFNGVDNDIMIKIINSLFDDLSEITSIKKYKNSDGSFKYIISIESKKETVCTFKLKANDTRIVQVNTANPYYLNGNDLIETTQYKILNKKIGCYYILDELSDEEYSLFDEDEELAVLELDRILNIGGKQKIKG